MDKGPRRSRAKCSNTLSTIHRSTIGPLTTNYRPLVARSTLVASSFIKTTSSCSHLPTTHRLESSRTKALEIP